MVRDTEKDVLDLKSSTSGEGISICFPNELPGIAPDREVEFGIEVILGIQPISIPPY